MLFSADATFLKFFGFKSGIHLAESPQKVFGKGEAILRW